MTTSVTTHETFNGDQDDLFLANWQELIFFRGLVLEAKWAGFIASRGCPQTCRSICDLKTNLEKVKQASYSIRILY